MGRINAEIRLTACLASIIILIIDSKGALAAATDGLEICLNVLIPSMLPLMVLCCLLTELSAGMQSKWVDIACKWLGLPGLSESILISGLLGGYPVGAITVTEAYRKGSISKSFAENILGCCSNAGPAFIFGVCATIFSSAKYCVILWLIQIVSALISIRRFATSCEKRHPSITSNRRNISKIVTDSAKNIANICAWIILFRILIDFMCRWFLWVLPKEITLIVVGILDLSNGAVLLQTTSNDSIRLILASFMLSFGGICVYLQTRSLCTDLSARKYIPQKLFQGIISAAFAIGYLMVFQMHCYWLLIALPIIFIACYLGKKKNYAGKIAKHHV